MFACARRCGDPVIAKLPVPWEMRVLLQCGARGMVIPWNFLEEVGAREEKRVEGMFQPQLLVKGALGKQIW